MQDQVPVVHYPAVQGVLFRELTVVLLDQVAAERTVAADEGQSGQFSPHRQETLNL